MEHNIAGTLQLVVGMLAPLRHCISTDTHLRFHLIECGSYRASSDRHPADTPIRHFVFASRVGEAAEDHGIDGRYNCCAAFLLEVPALPTIH